MRTEKEIKEEIHRIVMTWQDMIGKDVKDDWYFERLEYRLNNFIKWLNEDNSP